jgi:cardiolipin synthase
MSLALIWPQYPLAALYAPLLFVLHLVVAARAITRPNRIPVSRVAWVAVIMFLPLLGVVAYLFLGETSIGRRRIRRLNETEARMQLPDDAAYAPTEVDERTASLFRLGHSINGFGPVGGNRIALLGDPDAPVNAPMRDSDIAIDALVADIEQAREHVHINFYIWLNDRHGGKVADAVCSAARRGVRCRVLVDALGSRDFVHCPRWRQLRDAGVRTSVALDDIPRLGHLAVGRLDLRNHRKIVVIDNRIAYCGSQNCADPQFLVEARFAPWVDIFFRCEGPIVRQAQYLFLSAWIAETGEQLETLPSAGLPQSVEAGVVAQMFGTGPTIQGNAMSDMFVAAICAARGELLVTTPYFAPDEALLRALCAAPRRGVDTKIVFPLRNNSWLSGSTCRSAYAELLASGVEVYEYPLGLLHTKSMTIDGEIALVGSANMDRRSLELNYENNLLIADRSATQAIRQRQLGYLAVSQPVAIEAVRGWSFRKRLVQDAVAMMAPIL